MQRMLFSLKRAHQSLLRFCRHALKGTGLTAARYDMLHALRGRKNGVAQRWLEELLGVTGATVSRMLGSLEDLGLVRREVDPSDRRCNWVWLTDEGLERLEAAYERVVRPGWVRFALDWTLVTRKPGHIFPHRVCYREMMELDVHLVNLRRGFADTGSLTYKR
jgi:DNA-binding MarR family transcriptional regulator